MFGKYPWKKIFQLLDKYEIRDLLISAGKKPACYKQHELLPIEDAKVVSSEDIEDFVKGRLTEEEKEFFEKSGYVAFTFVFEDKLIRGRLYLEQIGDKSPHINLHLVGHKGFDINKYSNYESVFEKVMSGQNLVLSGKSKTLFIKSLLEKYEKPAIIISDVKEVIDEEKVVQTLVYPYLKIDVDILVGTINSHPLEMFVLDHPSITVQIVSEIIENCKGKQFIVLGDIEVEGFEMVNNT